MKTMSFRRLSYGSLDYFVWMHTNEAPGPDAWDESMQALAAYAKETRDDLSRWRGLVFTDGGAPSAVQRAQLSAIFKDRPVRVSVISRSSFVRAVVTALTWFNLRIKAFSPADVGRAFEYLEVRPPDQKRLWNELAQMEAECRRVEVLRAAQADSVAS
jgi:hypothetical protein